MREIGNYVDVNIFTVSYLKGNEWIYFYRNMMILVYM